MRLTETSRSDRQPAGITPHQHPFLIQVRCAREQRSDSRASCCDSLEILEVELSTRVIIWGTGGHAVSVSETVRAAGGHIVGYVSEDPLPTTFQDLPVFQELPQSEAGEKVRVVVAIGDNWTREQIVTRLRTSHPEIEFPAFEHPSASVASTAKIAAGAIIMQGAIVGAAAEVGEHCLINTRASLDHESQLQAFSSLAPGAITGGRVRIGRRSAICIGAIIKHGVEVGEDVVVGAGSYVHESLPARSVAYGTPAKVRRARAAGDPYLR